MEVRTLVELYDERPLENVLGVEMFRPEQVIYVCPEGTPENAEGQLKTYFSHRGISVATRFLYVDTFDTQAILRLFRMILTTGIAATRTSSAFTVDQCLPLALILFIRHAAHLYELFFGLTRSSVYVYLAVVLVLSLVKTFPVTLVILIARDNGAKAGNLKIRISLDKSYEITDSCLVILPYEILFVKTRRVFARAAVSDNVTVADHVKVHCNVPAVMPGLYSDTYIVDTFDLFGRRCRTFIRL